LILLTALPPVFKYPVESCYAFIIIVD